MKCEKCGAVLKGQYCEYCGTKAEVNTSPKPFGTFNYNYTYTPDTKKPFATKTGEYGDYNATRQAPPGQTQPFGAYHYQHSQPYYQPYNPQEQANRDNKRSDETAQNGDKSNRSIIICLIICIAFGWVGFHRFYAGKIATGILYLCTFGLFGIGYVIDIFLIATGNFRDGKGRRLTWKGWSDF